MTFRTSAISLLVIVVLVLSTLSGNGQQTSTRYDYHQSTEALINSGMQALFICNGLFVSNRTLEQLYGAELKFDLMPLAPRNPNIPVASASRSISSRRSPHGENVSDES